MPDFPISFRLKNEVFDVLQRNFEELYRESEKVSHALANCQNSFEREQIKRLQDVLDEALRDHANATSSLANMRRPALYGVK